MKDLLYQFRIIHGRLHDWRIEKLPLYIERIMNPRAIYLVYTPEHGNLGDHAIAQSEIDILTELRIPYIEFTGHKLKTLRENHCLDVMNGRIILINGGGNLGTLWPDVDLMMQEIVQKNPKSYIFILPNSIYYNDSVDDQIKLKRSMEVYNSHPHLKLYAREKVSYEIMSSIYKNVNIVPDMALRMNKCKDGMKRKGCIICLRKDHEKTISAMDEKVIRAQVNSIFGDSVQIIDTKKNYAIPSDKRLFELDKQFDVFNHAELVVTDRLHGMIFCAITGTPCIVVDSKSPKVKGCYEWIRDLPYIQFCEDVTKIVSIYNSIPKKKWEYENKKIFPLYESLKNDVLMAIKKM